MPLPPWLVLSLVGLAFWVLPPLDEVVSPMLPPVPEPVAELVPLPPWLVLSLVELLVGVKVGVKSLALLLVPLTSPLVALPPRPPVPEPVAEVSPTLEAPPVPEAVLVPPVMSPKVMVGVLVLVAELVPEPVAVLSPLALLAVWVWLPWLLVWSPLLPPVALDEPELVMVIEGVVPEPLLEPRPLT